jgi:peptidoglycan/LPS O-acetylase OafA/YrhL
MSKSISTAPASRISALDGIRGLAVLAVVVYHAWPSVLPGGWIGVSVFFTLSGFLITQIVDSSHVLTRSSLTSFWGRRARRLLPAALATIAATVSVVAVVDRDILRSTAKEGLAATFYVHNWWSISETGGYWEIFNSGSRPFAHLWSLSIEEQVYLLWPLLIVLVGLRRALAVAAVVVALGLAIWWGDADAYFATPFRFAEVFVGAVLAYVVKKYPQFKVPGFLALIAAAGLLWGVFVLRESDPFVVKGGLLLIGVAAMVVTGYSLRETKPNVLVGSAPLVWLGQRSYAIYLFHWPFLELLGASPFIAIALTLISAEISHHVLEWPIRSVKRIKRPLFTLGLVSLVSAIVLVAVIVIGPRPPSQQQINDIVAAALTTTTSTSTSTTTTTTTLVIPSQQELPVASTTLELEPSTTSLPEQEKIHVQTNPKVIIIGDSVAQNLGPTLDGWMEVIGGEIIKHGDALCGPLWSEKWYEFFTMTLMLEDGERMFGPDEKPCRTLVALDYNLVLVFDHGAIFVEYTDIRTDEKTTFPENIELVRESYMDLVEQTRAANAPLVFFTPPQLENRPRCRAWPSRENIDIYNLLIFEIAESEEHVYVLDTGPTVENDPDRYPRPDCIHFEALDTEGGAVNFVADLVAPEIIFDIP